MNDHEPHGLARRFWIGGLGGTAGAAVGWISGTALDIDLLPCILVFAGVFFLMTFLFGSEGLQFFT